MRTSLKLVLSGALIAVNVAGCNKPAEKVAEPSQVMKDTFASCTWEKVEGKSLSIWSYACGPDMGNVRLVADDKVGGFSLAAMPPDALTPRVVIRTFAKDKAAAVTSVLPAVLKATGAHGASCQLVETDYGDWGKVYLLEPTGAEKAGYDKLNAIEPQPNPCGELGIGPAGDRFFRVMADDPAKVIYYDMGSEIQIFDPDTLHSK
ncbi:hypothetical protein [Asticcacaulis benevestitus]|uniref:Uncharacterized protein n=1 Tax=Asticcacaulis benevestitus DSM 16100 = ATCC BAA-896 TaxID=1121022 RepID=V4PEK2_9CAUL|nr:hypothetical protein [Asticcacaulis benevestitus]ESQ86541.1 hypothetical protein ABENE_18185 [Asticcacaulis benevestitus DSM 16100 = ATCC BAA-896]